MHAPISLLLFVTIGLDLFAPAAHALRLRCPPDSVKVGTVCVDKYEASVWQIPADNGFLLWRAQTGRATLADLTAGGATQLGAFVQAPCTGAEYGAGFPPTGSWTAPVYALSVASVKPSSCITWYQAEQACRLAGKRLLTNQEWQAAAAGTPDPDVADDGATTCATTSPAPASTGERSGCVSAWGTHDMVGNLWEWVATWGDMAAGCTEFSSEYGRDMSCLGADVPEPTPPAGAQRGTARAKPDTSANDIFPVSLHLPAAWIRGGNFAIGTRSGVFAVYAAAPTVNISRGTGFRCGR